MTEDRLNSLLLSWQEQQLQGRDVPVAELCRDCPELAAELSQRIQVLQQMRFLMQTSGVPAGPAAPEAVRNAVTSNWQTDGASSGLPETLCQTEGPAPGSSSLAASVPGYEVLGELGRGGMGVVYRARQIQLNRLVALKMILAGGYAGAEHRTRFRTEAEAIARLQHPNIVQIHEVGEVEDKPYLALELLEGGSLDRKLRGTPLPPQEAARLVEALTRAMQAAHQKQIVHRDLKPANVLLSADGTPKITDFGLAKKLDEAGQTQSGVVMGTPSYMAPEQARGHSKEIGPAADVYALGAILYECLTGRPPFKAATSLDTILQVVQEEPVPPGRLQPKLPLDLETVCLKCLHKEPDRRYATAAELAEDLRRFQAGEPVQARPVGVIERGRRWCRRNPALAVALLTVALALLAGTIISVRFGLRAEQARQGEAARARSEATAKHEAERARRDAQRQLIDLCGSSGLAAAKEGDPSLALLWFARAAQLAREEPQQNELNRIRVANWLRQVFLPEGSFTIPGFRQMQDRFRTCAFSPDGYHLLAVTDTGACLVWDRRQGRLAPLPGPASKGAAAAWQPGSGQLAVAGKDGRIRLLAPPTFLSTQELQGGEEVTVLAFSRDGKRLAWGGARGARVWDQEKKEYLTPLLVHPRPVTALSFSAAGDLLATSASDFKARVFRVGPGESEPLFPPVPHASNLSGFNHGGAERIAPRFAANDSVLLTVQRTAPDSHALVWRSPRTGKVLAPNAWFREEGYLASFVASPQGDRVVAFWDAGGRLFAVPPRGVRAVIPTGSPPGRDSAICEDAVFADNGRTIVTGGHNRLVRLWSLDERLNYHLTESLPPVRHTHAVVGVALSPDGRCLAAALWSGTVCLWRLPQGPPQAYSIPVGRATLLARSPDRRLILPRSTSYQGTTLLQTRVYHAESGEPAGPVLAPGGILLDAAFSPDGTRVAMASSAAQTPARRNQIIFEGDGRAGNVQVWDWKGGKRLVGPIPTPGEPRGLTFRPDGRLLAVVCADYHVLLIDSRSGAILRRLDPGARSRPYNANQYWGNGEARFSPDGRFLVTWEFAPAVHVWNPQTGQLLHTLPHHGRVDRIAFHPTRPTLMATGGRDNFVRLWDLEPGKLISRLQHPFWNAGRLEFSADGTELICGSDDMPRVWNWKTGQLKDALTHSPGPLLGFGFTAHRRWLVGLSFKTLQLTDWRTKLPASPEYKLERGPHLSLALSRGERRAIVSGFSPSIVGYDLEALVTPAKAPAEELVRLAEVVAGRRILSEGRVVPLTSAEWVDRWQLPKRAAGPLSANIGIEAQSRPRRSAQVQATPTPKAKP